MMEAQLTCIFSLVPPHWSLLPICCCFLFMFLLLDECCFSTQCLLCLLRGLFGAHLLERAAISGADVSSQPFNREVPSGLMAWTRAQECGGQTTNIWGLSGNNLNPSKNTIICCPDFQNLIQFCTLRCCKEYIFILQTKPLPWSGWDVFVNCNSHEKYKYKMHNAKGT